MTSSTRPPAGERTITLRHAARDRRYLLRAPRADGDAAIPIVLELHGRGIDPVAFDRWTRFGGLADRFGFALALPYAVGEVWADGRWPEADRGTPDDVGYLLAVVEDAATRLPIDRERVYVVGMSNGATMAGRMACEHAELFAGVAQVAGTVAVGVAERSRPGVPLPILSIHGTADRFQPYEGGQAQGLLARLLLRQRAGPGLGVDAWAEFWTGVNDAAHGPEVESLAPDTTIRRWRGASPASDVAFVRIDGGGHTWPGNPLWTPRFLGRTSRSFDASWFIWEFFAAHRRSSATADR